MLMGQQVYCVSVGIPELDDSDLVCKLATGLLQVCSFWSDSKKNDLDHASNWSLESKS